MDNDIEVMLVDQAKRLFDAQVSQSGLKALACRADDAALWRARSCRTPGPIRDPWRHDLVPAFLRTSGRLRFGSPKDAGGA